MKTRQKNHKRFSIPLFDFQSNFDTKDVQSRRKLIQTVQERLKWLARFFIDKKRVSKKIRQEQSY